MVTMIPGDKFVGLLGLLGYWVIGFIESWTSQKTKMKRNGDREKLLGGMMKRDISLEPANYSVIGGQT